MVPMTRMLVRRPGRLVAQRRRHDDAPLGPVACTLIVAAAVLLPWALIVGAVLAVRG